MLSKHLALICMATLLIPFAGAAETRAQASRHTAPNDFPTHVVKVLRTTNKAQTNSYVPVVFDFKYNNPYNVIRFLLRSIQPEEGVLFTFVNPEGTGGKVLFVVPRYQVDDLRALVASLDRPGLTTSAGDIRVYKQLAHRRADASDASFLNVAASYSTFNGTVTIADPEVNALFYMDTESAANQAVKALGEFLDVPTPMVELVVKIYEIDSQNDATIGQDYIAWKNGPGANLFAIGAFAESASADHVKNLDGALVVPPAYGGLPGNRVRAQGYNAAYQYATSSAFFDFLQVKGKARMLNQVKLAALNTKTAEMTAGDQVLYYKVTTTDDANGGVRDTGDIHAEANATRTVVPTTLKNDLVPIETGIHLAFRPMIGLDSVNFDLALDWSDLGGFDDQGVPQINKRSFESKFRLGAGDELVLGGFKRQVRVRGHQGVPILSRIPVLGYLFGGETDSNKNTEVVVVVKPVTIFNYNVAGGYKVAPDDQLTIDKAVGIEPIKEPDVKAGFDQIGLDPARTATADAVTSTTAQSYNKNNGASIAK
ncbi:MAG: hypothetical protein ABFD69_09550 [Candidatus Sumerlaeia bacterium]